MTVKTKLTDQGKRLVEAETRQIFPRLTTAPLLGHDAVLQKFTDMAQQGRLAHGLMLTGGYGIGKATLAIRLAYELMRHQDELSSLGDVTESWTDTRTWRWVSQNSHPNMLLVQRAYDAKKDKLSDTIKLDQVAPLSKLLHQTAADGGWRVVIVDQAETMNRSVQNAVLKLLEEPPKQTLLVLTSSAPQRLLPTIRSRCQVWHLEPLAPDHMTQLSRTMWQESVPPVYLNLAAGSFGMLWDLVEAFGLDEQMATKLEHGWQSAPTDQTRLMALCDQLAPAKASATFDLWRRIVPTRLHQELQTCLRDRSQVASEDPQAQKYVAAMTKLSHMAQTWLYDKDQAYLDRRNTVFTILSAWAQTQQLRP